MNDNEYLGALVRLALEWPGHMAHLQQCTNGTSYSACMGSLAWNCIHYGADPAAALEHALTALGIALPERGAGTPPLVHCSLCGEKQPRWYQSVDGESAPRLMIVTCPECSRLPERGEGWTVLTDDPASYPSREYGEVLLTVYDKNAHQRDVWEAYWNAPYTIEADPDDPTTPYVWPGGWEYGDEGFALPEEFVPIAWMPRPAMPEPYQEATP